MPGIPKTRESLSLGEFLERPAIDEHPHQEYIDGRVVSKVSPSFKHSTLTSRFLHAINMVAVPIRAGEAFPELRCSYAGRSIIPDVAFLREAHIEVDEQRDVADDVRVPPDIHIEIISPKQGAADAREKLAHSTAHGCEIGWLVHPYQRTIDEYRPGLPPRRLPDDGELDGAPVLPGFVLPVPEVWGWMKRPRRGDDRGGRRE